MIIVGAKGMAKEVLHLLYSNGEALDNVCFYDDMNQYSENKIYNKFPLLRSKEDFIARAKVDPRFFIGVGGTKVREELHEKFTFWGGKHTELISKSAEIGGFGTLVGDGAMILANVIITNDVVIGRGVLLNKAAIVSHDAKIGDYCEISPGAKILGRAEVGSYSSIGTNAVVMPGVSVGVGCKVGAGSVVTKNIPDGMTAYGIPSRCK